jgi:hypothetical protein
MAPNYQPVQRLTKEPEQSSTFVQAAILRSGQNVCNLNDSIEDLWEEVVGYGWVVVKVSRQSAVRKS